MYKLFLGTSLPNERIDLRSLPGVTVHIYQGEDPDPKLVREEPLIGTMQTLAIGEDAVHRVIREIRADRL